MKPNFALKLSFDSVVLLHRVQHGWLAIGEARLDAPELDETLGQLRDTARQLEPHGLITKLILPEDEVLYRVIEAPGPGFEQRRAQIAAELEGYTPYRLDELIFVWSGQGRRVQVAVIAREMFDQAEEFAHKHGFNPVSVVAQPEPGSFEGEPFFGMTRVGHDILPRGIKVTPDTEPVRITGRAGDPVEETGAVASRLATAAAATGGAASGRAATGAEDAPADKAEPPADKTQASADKSRPAPSARRADKDTAKTPQATGAKRGEKPGVPPSGGAEAPAPKAGADKTSEGPPHAAPVIAFSSRRKPREDGDALRAPSSAKPAPASPPTAGGSGAAAAAPQRSGNLALASRAAPAARTADPAPAPRLIERLQTAAREVAAPIRARLKRPEEPAPDTIKPAPKSPNKASETATAKPATASAARPAERKQEAPAKRVGGATETRAPDSARTEAPKPGVARKTAQSVSSLIPPARRTQPLVSEGLKNEAEALTVFGARRNDSDRHGWLRHPAVVLGGVVALFLVAAGLWAAFLMQTPEDQITTAELGDAASTSSPPPAETPAAGDGADGEAIGAPEPLEMARGTGDGSASADGAAVPAPAGPDAGAFEAAPQPDGDPADSASEPAPDIPSGAAPPDGEQATAIDRALGDAIGSGEEAPTEESPADEAAADGAPRLTPEEIAAAYENSGIWPFAPEADAAPQGDSGDALFTGDLDATPAPPANFEAPEPTPIASAVPAPLLPPPPADTEFALDERGLVIPTAEGAMAPSGVRVFAGQPDVAPPARAARRPDELVLPVGPADPTLATFQPQPRPEDLAVPEDPVVPEAPEAPEGAPPAEDDGEQQGALPAAPADVDGATRLAGLIDPRARPARLAAVDSAAEDGSPDATAPMDQAAEEEAEEAPAPELASDSPLAVAVSRAPQNRPDEFSAATQQAIAAAQSQGPLAGVPAPSAQPEIPSNASVAEQATRVAALDTRQVNLIGVFGAEGARRALVRLSNGRVVRVGVGDRLDGGEVAAIGETELRYVKRGRNLVLRIAQHG